MKYTLYIIHGWTYSIEKWAATVQELRNANINIVQLRVPGLTTNTSHAWTIDQYVKWLDDELKGIEKPIVLGHSNGGRIALHYALMYPKKLHHLILLDSAGIEISPKRLSRKRRIISSLARLFRPLKHIPLVSKVAYRLIGSDYGAAPAHMKETLVNMFASDKDFDPSLVTTPTSILWGEGDHTTPVAMANVLHKKIHDSTLKIMPQWHHAPYVTHASELAKEIRAIMKDIL